MNFGDKNIAEKSPPLYISSSEPPKRNPVKIFHLSCHSLLTYYTNTGTAPQKHFRTSYPIVTLLKTHGGYSVPVQNQLKDTVYYAVIVTPCRTPRLLTYYQAAKEPYKQSLRNNPNTRSHGSGSLGFG